MKTIDKTPVKDHDEINDLKAEITKLSGLLKKSENDYRTLEEKYKELKSEYNLREKQFHYLCQWDFLKKLKFAIIKKLKALNQQQIYFKPEPSFIKLKQKDAVLASNHQVMGSLTVEKCNEFDECLIDNKAVRREIAHPWCQPFNYELLKAITSSEDELNLFVTIWNGVQDSYNEEEYRVWY
jgi:hypothetical protein